MAFTRWACRHEACSPEAGRHLAAPRRSEALTSYRAGRALRAAGGVVFRVTPKGRVKVLIVHRPRYDDWGLPKGKLDPGETDEEAALREVLEETGYRCRIVATLPETSHQTSRGGKSVAWFAMRPLPDSPGFAPNDEIDEVRWLSPRRAARAVDYENDRRLIEETPFDDLMRTGSLWIVRHGVAVGAEDWAGKDEKRPLDSKGKRQAKRVAAKLVGQDIDLILSSPAKRCRSTVAPLARVVGTKALSDERLSKDATRRDAESLLDSVAGYHAVICTHGETIPSLLAEAARRGAKVDADRETAKGSWWHLEMRKGKFRRVRYREN